jgi:hypothetical protein
MGRLSQMKYATQRSLEFEALESGGLNIELASPYSAAPGGWVACRG